MGYTTEFSGSFKLDRKLNPEHAEYLRTFAHTRRMARNVNRAEELPDPKRWAAGLPIGAQGGYFVGGFLKSVTEDASVTDFNKPPAMQPGLWCQWTVGDDDQTIKWDGGEKFYYYVEWLRYLIQHFIGFWGYKLNGEVSWEGERSGDMGQIVVRDNVITTRVWRVFFEDAE